MYVWAYHNSHHNGVCNINIKDDIEDVKLIYAYLMLMSFTPIFIYLILELYEYTS